MNVTKAQLLQLHPYTKAVTSFMVQFNPESLKVSFQNQLTPPPQTPPKKGADQSQGTAGMQFVGQGTTKLSVQLWFDVTGEIPNGLADDNGPKGASQRGDVRELTRKVVDLITPIPDPKDKTKFAPPGVQFVWGSFFFEGIMDSLEQSLEFFSAEGVPLRASMSLSLSQQRIEYKMSDKKPTMGSQSSSPSSSRGAGAAGSGGSSGNGSGGSGVPSLGGDPPGTSPLAQATAGVSFQGMAASLGTNVEWQSIALANNIENPRLLAPGQLVNMNISTPVVSASTPDLSISGNTSGFRFQS